MYSRRLHEISEGLLSDYDRQREQHPEKKSPLLDKAMENTELARSDLVQLVLESLLAGVDTSSVSLFYTLSFLSQTENRDMLRQAVEEVDTFVHHGDKIKAMSLPFIRACIKEAMRLKPVGPIIMRKAAQQDNVGTTIIQPGDSIILNLAQMNLKGVETSYSPSRFLNEEGQHTPDAQLPFGYFPFGDGPKGCVVVLHLLRGVIRGVGHDEGRLTPRRAIGPRSVLPNKSAVSGFGAVHDEDLLPAEELGPREVPPTRITTRSRCRALPLRPRGDVCVTQN